MRLHYDWETQKKRPILLKIEKKNALTQHTFFSLAFMFTGGAGCSALFHGQSGKSLDVPDLGQEVWQPPVDQLEVETCSGVEVAEAS